MTSAPAFDIVKICGAAYLIYLGIRAFMAMPSDTKMPQALEVSPGKALMQAIFAEVLNPKTALFFLAFMPQFVNADRHAPFAQFLLLGFVFVGMGFMYTTALAVAVRPLGRIFGRLGWLRRWHGKFIGMIFISLGLRVALQRQ
jgi:threonine/homoserine/homoserine lactone efflux protein